MRAAPAPGQVFYFDGLGLTRDARKRFGDATVWANLGAQQFHLQIAKPSQASCPLHTPVGRVSTRILGGVWRLFHLSLFLTASRMG